MKIRTISAAICLALLAPAPALAAATAEGAEALKQQFISYFGPLLTDQGILTIELSGEDYKVSLDGEKAFGLLKLPSAVVKMERYSYFITPGQEGAWTARGDQFPSLTFLAVTPKGNLSGQMDVRDHHFEAAYDPKLQQPFYSSARVGEIDAKVHVPEGPGQGADIDVHESGLAMEVKAVRVEGGAMSFSIAQSIKSVTETVAMTGAPKPGGPFKLNYQFGEITGNGALTALRFDGMRELIVWLVTHKDDTRTDAMQLEAKVRVLALLPLWDNFSGDIALKNILIEAPQGSVKMQSLSESLSIGGLSANTGASFAFAFKDLAGASPMLPPFAQKLMPASFDFEVKATVAGMDKVARIVLEATNLNSNAPLSNAVQAQIAAVLMNGAPKLTLAPGHFTIPLIDVGYEGEITLAQSKPVGHFVVTADGFDKTMALLQDSANKIPEAQNATLALTFAKGLAKTDASGKLTWVFDIADEKSFTVNGQRFPLGK